MTVRSRILAKLTESFAPSLLEVIDESHQHAGHAGVAGGQGETHFRVIIGATRLDGLGRVAQHRLVNAALSDELAGGVHALAIELPGVRRDAKPATLLTLPPAEPMPVNDTILNGLIEAALAAGREIMAVYATDFAVEQKDDKSPVTEADRRAEAVILERLARVMPGVPVVAEEEACDGRLPADLGDRFVLVDPLDGTREFCARNGEFTVNIALIEGGAPRAGAVYAPVSGRLWVGGETAWTATVAPGGDLPPASARQAIHVRAPANVDGLVVLESRSHPDPRLEQHLEGLHVAERRKAGSSLKFCLLAEGVADYYPRFGPTMEWDTAAGDAVLRAAGGLTETIEGDPLHYGKALVEYHNPDFVARGAQRPESLR
eukprot:gene22508-23691_t